MLNRLPLTLKLEDKQSGSLKTKEDAIRQFSAVVSSKNCKNFNMQGRVPLYSAGDAAPLANVNLYFITAQLILSI